MRISKLLSAVCAAVFLAGSVAVRAQDTPAQAAARAALMEKMAGLDAQPGPPTNQVMAPAIVVTPPGALVAQPSPPANQTTATATPPETPLIPAGANDTPAQMAARAALMDKMNDLNAQQNQPTNATTSPLPSSATTPAETQSAPAAAVAPVPPPEPAAPTPKTQPATWTPMPLPDPTKIPPDQMQPPPATSAITTPTPAIVVTPPEALVAQPSPPVNQTTATATPPETPLVSEGANDTPAQASARAALMDKMNALDARQNQTANPNLAPIVLAPSGTAVEQPGQPANATTVSPPPVTTVPAQTHPAPAAAVAPVQTPKPVNAPVPSTDNSGFFTPVPPPSNPGGQAGVQSALQQKESESNQQPVAMPPPNVAATPAVAPAVKLPPANVNYAGKTLGFKPVEAPPPPVTAQKVAELQALLARYMANQVSPDEYQKERAAILAEP